MDNNINDMTIGMVKAQIIDRVNKDKGFSGQRIIFGSKGTGLFNEWKRSLVTSGYTRKEAKSYVDNALHNSEGSLRWAQFAVVSEAVRAKGFVPSHVDINRVGTAASARFIVPGSATAVAKRNTLTAQLNAAQRQIEDLEAKIQALESQTTSSE